MNCTICQVNIFIQHKIICTPELISNFFYSESNVHISQNQLPVLLLAYHPLPKLIQEPDGESILWSVVVREGGIFLYLCLVLVSVVEGDVKEPRVHSLDGVCGIPDVDLVTAACGNIKMFEDFWIPLFSLVFLTFSNVKISNDEQNRSQNQSRRSHDDGFSLHCGWFLQSILQINLKFCISLENYVYMHTWSGKVDVFWCVVLIQMVSCQGSSDL